MGLWPDPATGRRRRVWAFSMVLPYSRHLFVRPTVSMTQQAWIEAHVAAFEFFGGAPRRLVPDNLKAGVCKPDLYDPKINRGYAELARLLRVPGRPGPRLSSPGQGRHRGAPAVYPLQLLRRAQLGVAWRR